MKNFKSYSLPKALVKRDDALCVRCKVCVNQCTFGVHEYNEKDDTVTADSTKCVLCHRCDVFCPTDALTITEQDIEYPKNANWTKRAIVEINKQAETGGILLTGMGNDKPHPIYWDHLLLDASQVTNPSIDPLREPMELKTFLGSKPDSIVVNPDNVSLVTQIAPQIELSTPIMFSAMSYGSISYNICESLARAATECGICYNTGEGGLHKNFYHYGKNTIVQVASGRFGVHQEYLNAGAAVEIKIGQGAKPGIGGHLPGKKVSDQISITRMIPKGSDAISPAPHHDIYSIEDLRQLIYAIKEATHYTKPVSVKISAVHNVAAIASGIVRAGADIVAIDGFRGGTGAAPLRTRDNVGIPIELAIAAVDDRLRAEGIRNHASVVAAGGFRNSADVIKAIALGADAVYIGTSALIALGCTQCHACYTGKCAWGLTTTNPHIMKRVNPDIGAQRLVNLITAWSREIKELLGGMGLNAIESVRGNRDKLRAVGLGNRELQVLGVKVAGE